jgi:hypothetical protein
MDEHGILRTLITKWMADSEGYKAEAERLGSVDLSRHSTSIAMLEARALALDKCILDAETLAKR